ncbi:MAG TPA: PilZ domain-containing protein [Thermoanaerobaculia bacterium]|nr:PilZ domain-containing protein [Thermoanaerobaculia bacterium]
MALRSYPRYFLIPPLFATAGAESVRIVDLSLKGARLELNAPLRAGSRHRLVVMTNDGVIDEQVTVLWSQIDDLPVESGSDRYMAGIEFDGQPEAVGELIERLLSSHNALPIEDSRSADRYRVCVPMTGIFGILQIGVLDLSTRGARISLPYFIRVGTVSPFAFQIDEETGPIEVLGTVAWCIGTAATGFEAGLRIENEEDRMRTAIHRLCMRDEVRIDLHSLRRKFDALRQTSHEFTAAAAAS